MLLSKAACLLGKRGKLSNLKIISVVSSLNLYCSDSWIISIYLFHNDFNTLFLIVTNKNLNKVHKINLFSELI